MVRVNVLTVLVSDNAFVMVRGFPRTFLFVTFHQDTVFLLPLSRRPTKLVASVELTTFNYLLHFIHTMSISTPLYILYGSATGNAEHIAKALAETAKNGSAWKSDQIHCLEANQFKKHCLPIWEDENQESSLLIVASTTGNGDAPENAGRFVRHIKRKTTSPTLFDNVSYAVLALGDTNYDQFCACGKLIDRKLKELGGKQVESVACADEGTGLEAVVDPWTENILSKLAKAVGGAEGSDKNAPVSDESKQAEELEAAGATTTAAAADQANKQSSSPGVLHLKALLKLQPTDPLPSVEQQDLPKLLVTKFSSCSLVEMDSTAAAIAAEEENIPGLGAKSVSTSSSSQYFTADRPFQSTIRKARYLTHMTSPDAAQRVAEQYFSSNSSTTEASAAWYESAAQIYNEQFPLTGNEKDRNGKRVIEMTLTLPDDLTLEYAPGDSLGLLVDNTPAAVHFILTMLDKYHNIKGDQQITSDHFEGSVRDAITKCIDLSSINPVQPRLLRALAAQCAAGQEEDRLALEYLASRAGHDLFMNMIHEQRWTMIDLLQQFPSLQPQMSLENLFALLPQIPPRYYSVSSSPTVGRELTVTFAVVDYLTPALLDMSERRIHGLATRYLEAVCSPFLCGIEKGSNTYAPTLRIFPKPTADFRLPATIGQSKEQPLILIGPGTGIAPFVGFLRHMKSIQEQAKAQAQTMVEGTWRGDFEVDDVADETKSSMHIKIPPVYVYFGCRNEEHDYLYKDELAQYKREGLISALYTAFSRDGSTERKYVQDCMEEGTLSDLIVNQKAFVYVCGDGNKMAKDVQAKIASLLPGDGPAYLDQMKKEKRFLLDIWS